MSHINYRTVILPCLAMLALAFVIAITACSTDSGSSTSSPSTPVGFTETPLAAQDSPVLVNGALAVSGTHIVNAAGEPVQFKGMSLFWSQWGGKYYTSGAIGHTRNYWNASIVRAAMGVESDGYLTNPDAEKQKVKDAVQAAVDLGIYVIIDWHDHNAHSHTSESAAFFAEMAALYKDTPNVLFEIYNEPLNTASWGDVKEYALVVTKAIRDAGAKNIIIVGSPSWSQKVKDAAADPITGYDNIAYSLHFYAGSHGQSLRSDAEAAMSGGIAIFVTEWGTCDASGNGGFNTAASDEWLSWMDENKISWCNWSLFDKEETASALLPGASESGDWTQADYTASGLYVIAKMRSGGVFQE